MATNIQNLIATAVIESSQHEAQPDPITAASDAVVKKVRQILQDAEGDSDYLIWWLTQPHEEDEV